MTSEQLLWTAVVVVSLAGCTPKPGAEPLTGPYPERRVWAVAPLRNESGSMQVDGASVADQMARRLENATNLDVLPVNRVLSAMEALGIQSINTPNDALKVLITLGADGLVIGTVTAYDPYDPPKLGMAIELYTNPRHDPADPPDLQNIRSAAVDRHGRVAREKLRQPVTLTSGFFDAGDPDVRQKLRRYGSDRGATNKRDDQWIENPLAGDDKSWRFHRISMELYTEFVCYVMSRRLLEAERERLNPQPMTAQAAP